MKNFTPLIADPEDFQPGFSAAIPGTLFLHGEKCASGCSEKEPRQLALPSTGGRLVKSEGIAIKTLFFLSDAHTLGLFIPKSGLTAWEYQTCFPAHTIYLEHPCWVPEHMGKALGYPEKIVVVPGNYPLNEVKTHYCTRIKVEYLRWEKRVAA